MTVVELVAVVVERRFAAVVVGLMFVVADDFIYLLNEVREHENSKPLSERFWIY